MARRRPVEPQLGLEFLGPTQPRQEAAPAAAPLSRREARERENGGQQARERSAPPARRGRQERVERRGAKPARARAAASTRPPRKPAPKRARVSKVFSLVTLLFAGALIVGMSVPANLFSGGVATVAAVAPAAAHPGSQSVDVSADAAEPGPSRDSFSVVDYAALTRAQYGTQSYSYSVTTGAVRWPFPYVVPISDGFGPRSAPCSGCSTMHLGLDFTPGAGTPIYAIADGVVTEHTDEDYAFGNHVVIKHDFPGQNIESLYAHMQAGSSPLVVGQSIKVGDFIGLVGETGTAVGAHLHFEIHLDKTPIDPFAWLQENAVN